MCWLSQCKILVETRLYNYIMRGNWKMSTIGNGILLTLPSSLVVKVTYNSSFSTLQKDNYWMLVILPFKMDLFCIEGIVYEFQWLTRTVLFYTGSFTTISL